MSGRNGYTAENERLNALLIPYLRGELAPLEAQWVRARLGRSPELSARAEALRGGLEAAREYSPRLEGDHRARLLARVAASQPRGHVSRGMALGALGAAAAVALAVTVGFLLGSEWPAGDAASAMPSSPLARAIDFSGDELPGLTVEPQRRNALTPHLRSVVSEDWVGRVDGDEHDIHVRVEQGAAAFAFRGGEGRRLEVSTEHARVRVVGTRFSVGVSLDGAVTTVEVSQGTVEVWRGRERLEVSAGTRARITRDRVVLRRVRTADVLDDPYLVAITGERHPPTHRSESSIRPEERDRRSKSSVRPEERDRRSKSSVRPEERDRRSKSSVRPEERDRRSESSVRPEERDRRSKSSVRPEEGRKPRLEGRDSPAEPGRSELALAALERADGLARAGAHDRALAAYEAVIASEVPARLRQMAQLGRARTLGHLGQLRDALGELARLSRIDGEVGRQARLSRCEVQRRFQPCAAQRCFGALADDPDRALASEAARLFEHSRASGLRCEAHE